MLEAAFGKRASLLVYQSSACRHHGPSFCPLAWEEVRIRCEALENGGPSDVVYQAYPPETTHWFAKPDDPRVGVKELENRCDFG